MKLRQLTNNKFYTTKPLTKTGSKIQFKKSEPNINSINPLKQDTVSFSSKHKFKYNLTVEEAMEMFELLGCKPKINKADNTICIYSYDPSKRDIELIEKSGIDEDSLFQHVTSICEHCLLYHSKLTSMHSVEEVGHSLVASPYMKDLGALQRVVDLDLSYSNISTIEGLKQAGTIRHYKELECPKDLRFIDCYYGNGVQAPAWIKCANYYKKFARKHNLPLN